MKKLNVYLLIASIFLLFNAMTCDDLDSPVFLTGIELVNINNEKDTMLISDKPIKKEAYVIGVKYSVSHKDPYNEYVPINYYDSDRDVIENINKNPKIYCNNDFDENHPAGSDISDLFDFFSKRTLGQDLLLILKKAPTKGIHSFKVVFECSDNTIIEGNTREIELY